MQFRLPKPLHGWRVFIGEVGIIVIGVLIALAAQQLVELWQWNNDAAQAESAIRAEIARNAGVYDERSLVQPCADRRLRELTLLLRNARKDRILPDIEGIDGPPDRPTVQTAWNEASSSGALDHLDDRVRSSFAGLYAQTASYDEHINAEQLMWFNLFEIEHAPGPISDALLADATATAAKLHFQSLIDGLVSTQAARHARLENIRPSYRIVLDREGSRAEVQRDVRQRRLCHPLTVDGKPFVMTE